MGGLTNTQKKAVETTARSVCVSAGAGTGKTLILVERFLYLTERKLARPHEILAITFTEKAAQELKARIGKRLRESGLEEARRELETAYLGTIHSFCARILREHPIEAGVDPDFRVLEEDEANLLKETVLDELIEGRFQEGAIFELLRVYSEASVREAIRQVTGRVHSFGISLSDISSSMPQTAPRPIRDPVWGNDVLRKVLEALEPLKQLKSKGEDCAEFEEALEKTVSNWDDPTTCLSAEGGSFKQETDRPSGPKTGGWDDLETLKKIGERFQRRGKAKDAIGAFRNALDDWIACGAELLGQPVREAFLSLASDFERRYRALKRERSSLDFNDLEREAVRLIGGSEPTSLACRNWYRKNLKFLMIDEFQDTSPFQDRLITLISQSDNLFIVGDWRQSIYGFRGADVSLFLEKEQAFSSGDRAVRISLVENFRSRAELLNQINPFFAELWGEEKRFFEPLQAATNFPKKEKPSVEFLAIEREEDETVHEARMKEARVLAEAIRDLVASGSYDFKDFAMLFRVGTDIFFYEHELRNLHIPCYVVSGRGFYRQPEIRDLISFLELLENPHLDIPLASVLRSPLVQVSDDTLFWLTQSLTRANPSTPLYHALLKTNQISEIGEEDRAKLERFRAFFLELLEQKEKWTVSECLELILERTQYDRYVLGLSQGKRRFANLRKLLEMAREAERREPIHLGDFIRYVKGFETQEVRESEAQVEALEGNVVKLMTIHKAKGLEFKVVILPDLNRRGEKQRIHFLIDPQDGLGVRVFNEATRKFEDTLTYRRIKTKLIQNAREESKRLFYVGATRAKDHLILSGASKSDQEEDEGGGFDDGANWYEWLQRWSQSAVGLKRRVVQAPEDRRGRIPSPLAEHKKIRNALEKNQPIRIKVPEGVDQILESLKPVIPVSFERIDLPVSAYSMFEHDPEEYRRAYELGALPEEGEKIEEWSEGEDEEDGTVSARDFGTVIHRIFEHLVRAPDWAEEKLSLWLRRFASGWDEKTQKEAEALSRTFLRSKQFAEIRNARARHSELSFVLRLRSGIVQGTLDLLYQAPEGAWVILDYKTSRVGENDLRRHAERYRGQILLYALACQELLTISVACARLYFVRSDQSFDFPISGIDFAELKNRFETIQKEIIAKSKAWIQG